VPPTISHYYQEFANATGLGGGGIMILGATRRLLPPGI